MRLRAVTRRHVLRGLLGGTAVTVALPLLDCFLDGNGTALASGAPLPVRFGTWGWGLGMTKALFVPTKTGVGYDLPEEIAALAPVQKHINLFTNFNAFTDGAPRFCHYTGWVLLRSGGPPRTREDLPGETIDVTVAKRVGATTRFPSLTLTATGDIRDSFSYENSNSVNAAEWSPVALYQRLFGPDFQDPNAATFTPDPRAMVRRSVLSSVLDDTRRLEQSVGAADRARLDQYFTGLRELELRFERQLQKPEPIAACRRGAAPKDEPKPGLDVDLVAQRHRLMTELLVMALACDQTRVFNMAYSAALALTTRPGYDKPHHTATHEEPVDARLGYQPQSSWFLRRSMQAWAEFVQALAQVREGDGTLLDNVLVYATTDVSYARIHAVDGIPMFSAGRAGGRLRTGLHVDGRGTPNTRLGFTLMRTMGLDVPAWGVQSNRTAAEIPEIRA